MLCCSCLLFPLIGAEPQVRPVTGEHPAATPPGGQKQKHNNTTPETQVCRTLTQLPRSWFKNVRSHSELSHNHMMSSIVVVKEMISIPGSYQVARRNPETDIWAVVAQINNIPS